MSSSNPSSLNLQQPIVVLGMHRSGTSALAGALRLLGVDLGGRLLPPQKDVNEKGFWEHSEIVRLHEELLAALGFAWDDVRALPPHWWKGGAAAACREGLVWVLQEDFAETPMWGVKDPRICRLLPMWQDIFSEIGCAPFFVVIFRHPLEVAASLGKRDGIGPEKAALLTLLHLLDAEEWTKESPRLFVSYDQLLSEPLQVMERIAGHFGLDWSQKIEAAAPQIRDFLGADGRHHVLADLVSDSGGQEVEALAQKAYEAFLLLESGNAAGGQLLQEVRASLVDRQGLLGEIAIDHITAVQSRMGEVQRQLRDVEQNAALQIAYRDQLVADWQSRLKAVEENANAQIAYRDQLVADWQSRLKAVEDNANVQIAYRDQLVAEHERQIVELEIQVDTLRKQTMSRRYLFRQFFALCFNLRK